MTYLPKSRPWTDFMKFGTGRRLPDVINCAKFYLKLVKVFDSRWGMILGIPVVPRCGRQHKAWTTVKYVMDLLYKLQLDSDLLHACCTP